MPLQKYQAKRKFNNTPEPKGKVKKAPKSRPLKFVIQKHDASSLHYDLRLELDGVLKSWAVPKGPSMNPSVKRLAIQTEDHPLDYQNFEGSIPEEEYGGGEMIVWDKGIYTDDKSSEAKLSRQNIRRGINKGELTFLLLGQKLKGKFSLVKMKNRKNNNWLLIKGKDEYSSKEDITKKKESVLSGKPLSRDKPKKGKIKRDKQTKKDSFPGKIKPMLVKLVEKPFDRKDWFFEPKWDGYRALANIKNGKIELYSRNGLSFKEKYKPITEALKDLEVNCILDGEIVAYKNGKPDFHSLQRYHEKPAPIQYLVFDLLYYDNQDLRDKPLHQRKKLLKKILPENETILYSDHIEEKGERFFKEALKEDLEGMIAKDKNSKYKDGTRSSQWLKVKSTKEQEAIIVGFTKPRGSRKYLGALVLAVYENNKLKYIGNSGGGFSDKEIKDLYEKLNKIKIKKSPLTEKVPSSDSITWVRPKYICQVKFTEWTKSGRMRHPVYNGLRIDKKQKEVRKEVPKKISSKKKEDKEHNVKITNRDKVFFPDENYTKGDVINYYESMADILLPYLKDRPQNLNRHPNGIKGKNFFQKNITNKLPDYVDTIKVWSESNKKNINYIVCNNKETLLYLANLGCIELNPWNSRTDNLNHPDYMILDLDPNGRSFKDLIKVAKIVKKVLDLACEEHFPKTSGKTGIHIIVPLNGRYNYDMIKTFAELLMHLVNKKLPKITSLERSPKKRKNKIYLDYLQNRFGQTLACAYSLRPYKGATVSTPLEWKEVKAGLDPAKFNIKTIKKRIDKKGDLWLKTQQEGVDLSDAIRCLEENQDG